MELNFNTLILSLSKIKNLGRKRIFNLLSNIKNIDDHLINDIFIELKLMKNYLLMNLKLCT